MSPARPDPQRVLDFWFGAPGSAEHGRHRRDWFAKAPAFDAMVQREFADTYSAAAAGRLDAWQDKADTALALVIVLDQFPHHLFRGQAAAHAMVERGLAVAEAALARGFDAQVLPVQRIFYYLPFEHAEDRAMQARAVALFTELAARHGGFAAALDSALRHQAVIERFGRFPHRNVALGRESTLEEAEFLARPGSGF